MKIRVKIDSQTFEVEVGSLQERPIQATVDGEVFEIWPEEADGKVPGGQPVEGVTARLEIPCGPRTIPAAAAQDKSHLVAAPIPGVVVAVHVQPGQEVIFGQELCVLEAMKMKNAIRAGRAGKIAAVHVNAGETVRHNQVLMEFSD